MGSSPFIPSGPMPPRDTPSAEMALRRAVIATALAMSREGLSPGRSGNVSARWRTGMLITPTGMAYDALIENDIVFVENDGSTPGATRAPSSEWFFHQAIYRAKPEANAIVHCHSPSATSLACARKPIPAFHYMVAIAGGKDIPLAPYATFGTPELARAVVETLGRSKACLMANHGQIATGPTLETALDLAREVEILSRQYLDVLMLGEVHVLDDAEMERVLIKFATYGQQPAQPAASSPFRQRTPRKAPEH
jgi:L-fuculose-phosphate aldolase